MFEYSRLPGTRFPKAVARLARSCTHGQEQIQSASQALEHPGLEPGKKGRGPPDYNDRGIEVSRQPGSERPRSNAVTILWKVWLKA